MATPAPAVPIGVSIGTAGADTRSNEVGFRIVGEG